MTAYQINRPGVEKARSLIDAHHYDLETPWSEAAPSAEEENAMLDRHGWSGYGDWHLAVDADTSGETKGRYGFPYGDFRRVNRAALIHAEQRAAQNGHEKVAAAAKQLLEHLDATRGSQS